MNPRAGFRPTPLAGAPLQLLSISPDSEPTAPTKPQLFIQFCTDVRTYYTKRTFQCQRIFIIFWNLRISCSTKQSGRHDSPCRPGPRTARQDIRQQSHRQILHLLTPGYSILRFLHSLQNQEYYMESFNG